MVISDSGLSTRRLSHHRFRASGSAARSSGVGGGNGPDVVEGSLGVEGCWETLSRRFVMVWFRSYAPRCPHQPPKPSDPDRLADKDDGGAACPPLAIRPTGK